MAFTVSNRQASPALRGQCPVVTLTQAAADAYIATLAVGTLCTVLSSGKTGYIDSVDRFGHTFEIRPIYPFTLLDSTSEAGVLVLNETITIG